MDVAFLRARLRQGLFPLVALFVIFIASASSAFAQSTASLSGTVSDSTGAVVPGTTVTVKNQATGLESTTTTDTAGAYLFPTLPIGTYRLEIKATNFQGVVLTDIQLDVASAQVRDVQLKVGQASETVEIIADAAVVDTTTTSLGQVINNKTVQEIPLNGRHFTDLSLLTTGTVTPPANGFLSAPLRGQGSFGINTAGQREDTTNWLVNGINLNDNVQNQITFQPPIDTLAEYKIDNSSFPAQYGRNAGAIVNLATRSGTNEYHGELFEFFRNNALDARNVFNTRLTSTGAPNPQAPFKRNDFGASGGGPIKKNKVFFFLAYEGLRQHQSLTVASSRVPSQNERTAVTNAAIQKIVALIPAANLVGTGNATDPATFNAFTGGTLANVSLNQGSADIDVQLSEKDKIHGYYVVQKDLRQEPTAGGAIGANLPGFGDTRDGFRHLMTLSEDHFFGPSLTNTVRLGFNRIHLTFTPNQLLNPADFGINMPTGAPVAAGLPFFNIGNALGFAGPTGEPSGRGDTTAVLNDGLSWLRGRHTFVFGGEIRRAYNNNIAFNIGSFTFNATGGATPQTAMQNFLNDKASAFTVQLGSGNDRILQPSYDAFAQDSFKWKSNFTINVGLRYAWNSTPSETIDRFTQFDPTSGTLVPASQPYHTNNKNFQPRIGFAWDPFKNGKTSVRAAYAILTQDPTTNIVVGLSGNPPFAVPISLSSGAISIENPAPSTGAFPTSLGPSAINSQFNDMYAQDWNLTIDHQLTSSLGLSIAYVGLKGTHLQLNQNINQPLVTGGTYANVRPFPTLPASSTILPAQCTAPHPACTFGNINQVNSGGNSNYNALWLTLNKHFSHGLQVLTSYTYSKSLDYNSLSTGETYIIQNAYNPRGDYGPSEFDVRHRFVFSGFYQLPFKANRLVGGWEVGTVVQAQTGNPLNPTTTITTPISLTVRPDLIAPIHVTGDPSAWFGPASQFSAELASPCAGTTCHPGSLSRDAVTGPNFVNADFSVIKNTKLTERANLQFRTEMFDIFNHPNFGNPGLTFTPTSTTFGKITSTRFPTGDFGSSRQIQFALKLQF